MKVVQTGNTIDKLLKSMQTEFEVEVGHFQDQPTHYSGYTNPELMAFHNKDSADDFDNDHVPSRPILDITKFRVDEDIKRVLSGVEKLYTKPTRGNVKSYMQSVGKKIQLIEQDVFAKPPLTKNSEYTVALKDGRDTPMVDSGDLMGAIEVRVKVV